MPPSSPERKTMSIQKITQRELLENGVRSLPNRPSTPSLYSGQSMSAADLKAAFDRLPTLIAERFNDLLFATGLFDENDPKDMLSELIATGLFPEHSLSQFFEDVTSGALALYLKADGKSSLAEAITALREDLARLDTYSFHVEGQGELLSDVSVTEHGVTFHRENAAKEVLLDDTRPVSGGAVQKALTPLSDRISLLEKGAEGVLFQYPEIECPYFSTYAPANVLENAALIRFGASICAERNIFFERALTAYQGDLISIIWDSEAGCLVLNGTLPPASTPYHLIPYRFFALSQFHDFHLIYRGGSVSGGNASLCLISEKNELVEVPLANESASLSSGFVYDVSHPFASVGILAVEGVSFNDYRINLCVQENSTVDSTYSPAITADMLPVIPKTLKVTGPSVWYGEREKEGEVSVSFIPDEPLPPNSYVFSLSPRTDFSGNSIAVRIVLENGTVYKRSVVKDRKTSIFYEAKSPVVAIHVYATNIPEESEGYFVSVKDFQAEIEDHLRDINGAPGTPLSYTRTLPPELSRYAPDFVALSEEKFNYFDLEDRTFVCSVYRFPLDASLTFSPVSGSEATFSAPCTPPKALTTKEYRPQSLFLPKSSQSSEESVWFTESAVFIKTRLFANAQALTAFLALNPIAVLYEDTVQRLPVPLASDDSPILLPMRPCADIAFYNEEGKTQDVSTTVQYQTYV